MDLVHLQSASSVQLFGGEPAGIQGGKSAARLSRWSRVFTPIVSPTQVRSMSSAQRDSGT